MELNEIPELDNIANEMIRQAQGILRLNGAYRSGRLFRSFKSQMIVGPNGITISITNTAPYAKFINAGTYERRGTEPTRQPVIRKYASVATKPQGYPLQRGGYPWDRKGIEPIDFMNPINFNLRKLNEIMSDVFVKGFEQQILRDFQQELNK